jgi:hypothetical protein
LKDKAAILRVLYEPFMTISRRLRFNAMRDMSELREFPMVVALSMATLSAIAVTFYGTFLLALCKECRRHHICYVVCFQIKSFEHPISEDREREELTSRAA